MVDFHGLYLRNRVIAASSPATETVASVTACAAAGCGAVILKSVAPDRMRVSAMWTPRRMFWQHETLYMLSSLRREFISREQGVLLLEECRNDVDVPLIASAAGSLQHPDEWLDTLRHLAAAGATMLQMDSFYASPATGVEAATVARELVSLARECQSITSCPVLLKIGTAIPAAVIAAELDNSGIGVSLLDSICVGVPFDSATGRPAFRGVQVPGRCRAAGRVLYPLALLYAQRLSAVAQGRICGGGGVFSANDAYGLLCSGATCVQVATAVCVYGYGIITGIVNGLQERPLPTASEMTWRHEAPVTTTVNLGTVVRCAQPCHEDAPCLKTIMCERSREVNTCEGCGLCMDVCPSGLAHFEEETHEN